MKASSGLTMIDLSHPLDTATPAFPGDPPPALEILDSTDDPTPRSARHLNCSRLAISVHCGTHMDAPFHFFGDRTTIERVPLTSCIGPAVLVRLAPFPARGRIEPEHFAALEANLRSARRVVFCTGWDRHFRQTCYFEDYPEISLAAARRLVALGVQLVGVDFPSVDRAPYETHLELLGNEVLIVENLTNLAAIPSDTFHLVALPLPIRGRDGSPVRAVAVLDGPTPN